MLLLILFWLSHTPNFWVNGYEVRPKGLLKMMLLLEDYYLAIIGMEGCQNKVINGHSVIYLTVLSMEDAPLALLNLAKVTTSNIYR